VRRTFLDRSGERSYTLRVTRRYIARFVGCVAVLAALGGPAPARADDEHVVDAGETLWEIARDHEISVDALREANDLGASDRIVAGQRLRVPPPRSGTGEPGAPAPVADPLPPSPAPQQVDPPPDEPVPSPPTAAEDELEDGLLVPAEVENAAALAQFFDAAARAEGRRPGALLRVAHFGDSHTASPSFPGAIRAALAERFGDAGPGFVQPGKPWNSYRPPELQVGSTGTWAFDRVRRADPANLSDGMYGLGGWSARTAEPDAAVWVETGEGETAAGFEVEYLTQPHGGSAALLLDGEVVARIESAADGVGAARHRVQTEDTAHRLEIRAAGDGEFRLLGLEVARPGPGVLYDVLATNGARADWLLDWDEMLLADSLGSRDPDLIVLMFGTNEAEDDTLDLDRYARDFGRVLERLRTDAPAASCLVLAPPDMAPRRRRSTGTPELLPQLVEVQRTAALAQGCAFFDTFAAMGGAGAMERWFAAEPPLAARDRVHLTSRGYRALGRAIAEAVLRVYDARGTPASSSEPASSP
jgi:lysophospholipase L1-like esterase